MREMNFNQGEIILKEHDLGDTAYLIKQGRVEVSKNTDNGKIILSYLGAGDTFGEMSMIDDKPRSATVTAAEETIVFELCRDDFFYYLKTEPDFALNFLHSIFERLREANIKIMQLESYTDEGPVLAEISGHNEESPTLNIAVAGLTPEAIASLPEHPYVITDYPFLIGRSSGDPLVKNDLMITEESSPWQISRHHLKLVFRNGKIGLIDRGSYLGTELDGIRFGGDTGNPGPLFIKNNLGILVLGQENSPYRYQLILSTMA